MNGLNRFSVHTASVVGAEHLRRQINNQDSFRIGELEAEGRYWLWGVVCDGCSAGLHNEVGATLLANYLCEEIPFFISSGSDIEEIPDQLFVGGIGYLRSLAACTALSGFKNQIKFIADHLLCTVIGFIMDEKTCIFFNYGDGVYLFNDRVCRIDMDNKPCYMAYHLLDKSQLNLEGILPFGFEVRAFFVDELERFAVCSDGIEEGIANEIWGHTNPLGMKRRIRALRLKHRAIIFDDCTIIAVERIKEQG